MRFVSFWSCLLSLEWIGRSKLWVFCLAGLHTQKQWPRKKTAPYLTFLQKDPRWAPPNGLRWFSWFPCTKQKTEQGYQLKKTPKWTRLGVGGMERLRDHVFVWLSTEMYICIYTIYIYIDICGAVYVYLYIYIYVSIHIYIYIGIRGCVCIYIYIYICMYVYVCIYIYI